MRKLLLLTNFISLCVLVLACQTKSNGSKNNSGTSQFASKKDSLTPPQTNLKTDSADSNKPVQSEIKTSTAELNTPTIQKEKTQEIKRIENKGKNQSKLDSIKQAKQRLKNK